MHVKILFKHDAFDDESIESAWAMKIGNNYKLDNILFYAKEFSLGDIISANEINGELYADELIEESGHTTVRMLFNNKEQVSPIREKLKLMNCSSEISNVDRLISVDIPVEVDYSEMIAFLDAGEDKGEWEYEEASISSKHQNDIE